MMLDNLDDTMHASGAWDDWDVHFRYMTSVPISVVGRIAKSTPTVFWTNHLAAFKTSVMHHIMSFICASVINHDITKVMGH
jgi:hypothetical protein